MLLFFFYDFGAQRRISFCMVFFVEHNCGKSLDEIRPYLRYKKSLLTSGRDSSIVENLLMLCSHFSTREHAHREQDAENEALAIIEKRKRGYLESVERAQKILEQMECCRRAYGIGVVPYRVKTDFLPAEVEDAYKKFDHLGDSQEDAGSNELKEPTTKQNKTK